MVGSSDVATSRQRGPTNAMTCHQAIVWIDDKEAWILRMVEEIQHVSTILAESAEDPREGLPTRECGIEESDVFFHQVARALDAADEILVGPSATKVQLVEYMHKDTHSSDPRILGVEVIDHPNSSRLASVAKLYFTIGHPLRSSTEHSPVYAE
jgi:hypothetical protein